MSLSPEKFGGVVAVTVAVVRSCTNQHETVRGGAVCGAQNAGTGGSSRTDRTLPGGLYLRKFDEAVAYDAVASDAVVNTS